jgi:hypothetical protein
MRHNFSEEMLVKANITFSIFYDPNVCNKQDAIKSLNLISTNPAVHIYFDDGTFTASDPFAPGMEPVRFVRKKIVAPPPFQVVAPQVKSEAEIEQVEIPQSELKLKNSDNNSTFKALEGLN